MAAKFVLRCEKGGKNCLKICQTENEAKNPFESIREHFCFTFLRETICDFSGEGTQYVNNTMLKTLEIESTLVPRLRKGLFAYLWLPCA